MALTPEVKVKRNVAKLLKQYGLYYFFPAMGAFGRAGIPDIICCFNSEFVAIECKSGLGKLTALQERELEKIREAGGVTFVINETNLATLEKYLKGDS